VSAAVAAFDPATGTWQTWRDLPQARTSALAKALSGGRFVYCCGSAGTSNADGWMATPSTPVVAAPVGPPPVGTPPPVLTPSPPTKTAGPSRAALSRVGLHPSTVVSTAAGKAQLSYRLNHSVKVALVLQRCTSHGCTVVARRTVGSPRGPSHISVFAITGHKALPDGHYRLTATPAGGRKTTMVLIVRG
jgi:hypothetical protein